MQNAFSSNLRPEHESGWISTQFKLQAYSPIWQENHAPTETRKVRPYFVLLSAISNQGSSYRQLWEKGLRDPLLCIAFHRCRPGKFDQPGNLGKKDSGGRSELHRNAVHAVALVGRRLEAFSFEHMAQMPAASCACDLYPPTIRVRRPLYSSWKPFEEGWPATAGVKLGGGFVQGRSTASTVVHPTTVELVVLACSRQPGYIAMWS